MEVWKRRLGRWSFRIVATWNFKLDDLFFGSRRRPHFCPIETIAFDLDPLDEFSML